MTKQEAQAHFKSLSEEYGIPLKDVHALAYFLGPDEYEDGLVTACEDRGFELEREQYRKELAASLADTASV